MSLFLSRRKGFSSSASRLILEIIIQCSVFKVHRKYFIFPFGPFGFPLPVSSGDREIRTLDPLLARQVLSQLSYAPVPDGFPFAVVGFLSLRPVGLSGLEPPTSRLSGVRSNRLSYKPFLGSGSHLLSHTVSSIVPSAA